MRVPSSSPASMVCRTCGIPSTPFPVGNPTLNGKSSSLTTDLPTRATSPLESTSDPSGWGPSGGGATGRGAGPNVGAAAADGHHLVFLDADDLIAPGYLAAMHKGLERWGLG